MLLRILTTTADTASGGLGLGGAIVAAVILAVVVLAVIGVPVKREHDRYVDTFTPEPRGRHRERGHR